MKTEGPQLETLTRRLSECPADFLVEPRLASGGDGVDVAAVVYDLIRDLGGAPLGKKELARFALLKKRQKNDTPTNRLKMVLIACWLLHDVWFRSRSGFAQPAYEFLATGLDEMAELVQAQHCVTDADRREELARLCLRGLALRPAGESALQAQDRLVTLDSVERARVVRAAREAEERARRVREEMARKAAEEAAATWGRE